MDSFESSEEDEEKIKSTMLPYLTENAVKIVKFAEKHRDNSRKTGLRNILDAFSDSESELEANLFLEYYKAKNSEKNLELPELDKYTLNGGYYISKETNQYCYIWKDLINLIDFIE